MGVVVDLVALLVVREGSGAPAVIRDIRVLEPAGDVRGSVIVAVGISHHLIPIQRPMDLMMAS